MVVGWFVGLIWESKICSGFRRLGVGETVAPDVHERLEVATVGGFQRGEVGGAAGVVVGFEKDAGEVEPAEQFAEEEADGAAVEVACCWRISPKFIPLN